MSEIKFAGENADCHIFVPTSIAHVTIFHFPPVLTVPLFPKAMVHAHIYSLANTFSFNRNFVFWIWGNVEGKLFTFLKNIFNVCRKLKCESLSFINGLKGRLVIFFLNSCQVKIKKPQVWVEIYVILYLLM
jgi:hypothetical protein